MVCRADNPAICSNASEADLQEKGSLTLRLSRQRFGRMESMVDEVHPAGQRDAGHPAGGRRKGTQRCRRELVV